MTVTPASFRGDFPEFADTTKFPDASIAFWLNVAGLQLNATRWGTMLDYGTELFVAHNVTLQARNAKVAATGGIAGQVTGPVASESVGPVSVGYDTGAATIDGGGAWNLTTYGILLLQMAEMIGAGGAQF